MLQTHKDASNVYQLKIKGIYCGVMRCKCEQGMVCMMMMMMVVMIVVNVNMNDWKDKI